MSEAPAQAGRMAVPERYDQDVREGQVQTRQNGIETMNAQRAYSLLTVKALDEDRREISGIASTPEPDRMGDIVEPLGAKFADEIPLLWQHRHDAPVGVARFGKPTKSGIPFTASIASILDTGPLKDIVDMAWQAVKAKLVRGVSIGFRPLEYAYMEGGGIHFTASEIFELSLVTIPANASATIQTVKAMDWRRNTDGPVRLIVPKSAQSNLNGAVRLIRP